MLVGAIALNLFLFAVVPKGFFPEQDTGAIMGGLRADQSISFSDMQNKLTRIVRIIRKDPAVATVVAFTGGSRAGGGFMQVQLKPAGQRDPSEDVIARLRPKLLRVTGVSTFLTPVQDLRVGGRMGNAGYQYTLKADDPAVLKAAANKLADALKKEPTLTDIDVDQNDTGADVYVQVDRDSATRLGIDQTTLDNVLYDAFGQRQVTNIYSGLNQYHVIMEVDPKYAGAPEALSGVYLPTASMPSRRHRRRAPTRSTRMRETSPARLRSILRRRQ